MMFRLTEVVKHLLIINGLMFLVSNLIDTDILALSYFLSEEFQPFQLATYFFLHADFPHLLFNMISLFFFGVALEQIWGAKKFLFYYLFCAIGAAVVHYSLYYFEFAQIQAAIDNFALDPSYDHFVGFFHNHFDTASLTARGAQAYEFIGEQLKAGNPNGVGQATAMMQELLSVRVNAPKIVGASGAIFGLLMAYGMLFPEREIYLMFLPIGIKAKFFIPVMMLMELQMGVSDFQWDNVAHFAHLGGALFGAL
ncbi:MAG: rhomboid family intramembrane serine protease, partial [Bacteroidota bacterium]